MACVLASLLHGAVCCFLLSAAHPCLLCYRCRLLVVLCLQSRALPPRALRAAVESVAGSRSAIDVQIEDRLLSSLTHGIVGAFSRYLDMPSGLFRRQSLLRQLDVQQQIHNRAGDRCAWVLELRYISTHDQLARRKKRVP